MFAVVAMAAVWLLLIRPALDTLAYWDNELPRLRSQAGALREVLAGAGAPAVATPATSSQKTPRAAAARASLQAAGLGNAYRMREADATLYIEFERAADPRRVLTWLLDAPRSLGMAVREATLLRPGDDTSNEPKNSLRASVTLVMQEPTGNGS